MATRRGGRVPGAEGYSTSDTQALLRCINEVLPVSGRDWERVLQRYRMTHAMPNGRAPREVASLKSKFKALQHYKKGSDEEEWPAETRESRRIQRDILEKEKYRIDEEEDDDELSALPRESAPSMTSEHSAQEIEGVENGESLDVGVGSEYAKETTQSVERPSRTSIGGRSISQGNKRKRDDLYFSDSPSSRFAEDALHRQLRASERYLHYQLTVERDERQFERSERQHLSQKLERAEESNVALREKLDDMREKNMTLQLENSRLYAELCALRAASGQPRPT
ncbi:hypothetical protein Poli38472_003746 [Pythium oligandrum]|uniref:DUF6818 domain-containing protein n=1 Tax=Pythium oligandrum TaxID=41045 RepID=A0A8K1CNQ7_PYTOL|nr:hypothetical protein Poli38472_003746 [Pythium oligandrum]|eukprot:TMW65981.1 hypothetical protein Poli38472_003746 [Pythium oligandrum]